MFSKFLYTLNINYCFKKTHFFMSRSAPTEMGENKQNIMTLDNLATLRSLFFKSDDYSNICLHFERNYSQPWSF